MNPINQEKIILASASPRRKELMTCAGLQFDIHVADIDESAVAYNGDPGTYVKILSEKKAQVIAKSFPGAWTVGADTVVVIDDTILGKPADRNQAVSMLNSLNGRNHSVFTGFSVIRADRKQVVSKAVETTVRFKQMPPEEIGWYADTDEPYDKAGGYGIQGIGSFMVKEICGSYSNVVGLPVCELIDTLAKLNVVRFKDA
ncbi:MAG: Maf family protein [Desulfobacterales bacterium]|nr:Maf family protein [Desulfobacterales bacterium]